MKRIIRAALVAAVITLTGFAGTVSAVQSDDLHCPAGGAKTEANGGTQDAINDLVLPAGTVICVKAGPGNSGVVVADGVTDLQGYAPDGKDVSYYVIYEETQPSASPTASPTPTATPSPSSTPSPTPSSTPPPSEEPSASPSSTPSPTETPIPTASPTPSLTPSGEPSSTPTTSTEPTPNVTLPPTDTADEEEQSVDPLSGLAFALIVAIAIWVSALLIAASSNARSRRGF